MSKYKDPERSAFAKLLPKLNETTYGSHQYYQLLEELSPVLRKHYAKNRHHPQYYHDKNGFTRMSFLDKLEMLCDWKAATRRHDDGDLIKSIHENEKRFNYNKLHRQAMLRDAREIGLIE